MPSDEALPSSSTATAPWTGADSATADTTATPGGAPKRPNLVSRHSSSSHVSVSHMEGGPVVPRPGPARPHKHLVGHSRMGARNPSFHRTLSKVKIVPADAIDDDGGPPTPKAARHQHRRTLSTGPASLAASIAPPSPVGSRPAMRRNNTSLALPRTGSSSALKKNYSSGQLPRLASTRINSHQAHAHKTSRQDRPDIRRTNSGPNKRHKSPAPDRRTSVHFNVGSDDDDMEQVEAMEGVDDQWTEDSASASPSTTRDNTRSNTRANSVVLDPVQNPYAPDLIAPPEEKPPDDQATIATTSTRPNPLSSNPPRTRDFSAETKAQQKSHQLAVNQHERLQQEQDDEEDEDEDDDDELEDDDDVDDDDDEELEDDEGDTDTKPELDEQHQQLQLLQQQREELLRQHIQRQQDEEELAAAEEQEENDAHEVNADKHEARAADHPAQDLGDDSDTVHGGQTQMPPRHHAHSTSQPGGNARPLDAELISRRLLERMVPAPPRVSSISALANSSSGDLVSLSQSQHGNMTATGANNTPVVSRFVGPHEGIGSKDATPRKQSGFLRSLSRNGSSSQLQQDGNLQRNKSAPNFANQESTTPTGARTPDHLLNNSRTQQKLWLQRGLSNIEASSQPHLPALLPTGRAQAMRTPSKGLQFDFVDKEYVVVRRFQDPLLQGVERVKNLNGGILPGKPKKPLTSSASTTTVNGRRPDTAMSMRSVNSSISVGAKAHRDAVVDRGPVNRRAKFSFHTGPDPESGRQSPADEDEDDDDPRSAMVARAPTAAEIARRIWEADVSVSVVG